MRKTGKRRLYTGCQKLSSPQATVCTLADTPYMIEGTWGGALCNGFIRDGLGTLTYKGKNNVRFLLSGVSSLSTDFAGKVTYKLYVNGSPVPGAETEHDFTAPSKTEDIGITGFPTLNYNDEISVYCEHSVAGSTVNTQALIITFLSDEFK